MFPCCLVVLLRCGPLVLGGIFEQAGIDLTPVYRCLHIHDTLGKRDEFKDYYLDNRKVLVVDAAAAVCMGSVCEPYLVY